MTAAQKSKRRFLWWGLGVLVVLGVIGALAPDEPATTRPVATAPTATTTTRAAVKPAAIKPKPKPVVYSAITARQWKQIAKNPDTHIGQHVTIYGVVTQFDGATGDATFLADVDGRRHRKEYGYYGYDINTLMTGDPADLADLVEGDVFAAKVTVAGSESYDTQIGGNTTVPTLVVESIRVTGEETP
jgi:hypothetical protein